MSGLKTYTTIGVADSGAVRRITLSRPERRNAMTPQMQVELVDAFEDAAASDCGVLVLTGAGDAFCSGLDLAELKSTNEKTAVEHRADAERIARLFLALHELPMPTTAAVHGPAIAGGTGLATICDFTLVTPAAKFGFTEVRIGFVPALVSAFLALSIGHKQSLSLLLTGRVFGAEEALRLGLANEIVQREQLDGRVEELARALLANSPQALRATKRLMVAQSREWLAEAIAAGVDASIAARTTADLREGITAFLEKRSPVWAKSREGSTR